MTKRICWKKGMRLNEKLFRDSDEYTAQLVGKAFILASGGRLGLLPSSDFDIQLRIDGNSIEVVKLSCLAITKGGHLIDYDSNYNNSSSTHAQIPDNTNEEELLLTICCTGKWNNTNDSYEEPIYSYSFIRHSQVPDNSLPIAHIIRKNIGWEQDEDFVPPCLYITSHRKYCVLLKQFKDVLKEMDTKVQKLYHSNAIRLFGPFVQQLMITINNEYDSEYAPMTPRTLFANIQKLVGSFTFACELDEYLKLADAEKFRNFACEPYSYINSYSRIKAGLDLCYSINEKVEMIKEGTKHSASVEAPTIADSQCIKKCTSSASIQVTNNASGAKVYYTTDGSEPTQNSKTGQIIQIESGFDDSRKMEPDIKKIVKVKAYLNGVSSNTNTYEIILKKDINRWSGIEI